MLVRRTLTSSSSALICRPASTYGRESDGSLPARSGHREAVPSDTDCHDGASESSSQVFDMTRSTTGWFDFGGDDAMINAARELAPQWLDGLVAKEDTEGVGGLCVLLRDVPTMKYRPTQNCVMASFFPDDLGKLYGDWGNGNHDECHPLDTEAQVLAEAGEAPEAQAAAALEWMASQLVRTIERRTWWSWGFKYEAWHLSDTGTRLSWIGHPRLTGMRHRAPDSITKVRPRAA